MFFSNSIVSLFFFLYLNCLSTKNSTLNYSSINLLSTKRLHPNLINSFVKKLQFLVNIYANKTLEICYSKSIEKQNWEKETNL